MDTQRPRLRTELFGEVAAGLRPQRRPARLLCWFAVALAASAALHLVVFLVDGGSWAGPVSWRKPITFSASFGLILWAYGWILDRLPDRRRLAIVLAWGFALSCSAEVALIVTQRWRGQASHFNMAESVDQTIYIAMGVLVGIVSLHLVILFVWSLIERPDHPLEAVAVFAGLGLVFVSMGVGQWMLNMGMAFVDRHDAVPESMVAGEAGKPKFPHAIGLHGLQVFAVSALALRVADTSLRRGRRIMGVMVFGYSTLLLMASLQAIDGRSPADLGTVTTALSVCGGAAMLAGIIGIMHSWSTRPFQSEPPQTAAASSRTGEVPADSLVL